MKFRKLTYILSGGWVIFKQPSVRGTCQGLVQPFGHRLGPVGGGVVEDRVDLGDAGLRRQDGHSHCQ